MVEIIEAPDEDPEALFQQFRNRVFEAAESSVEWATVGLVHFDKTTRKVLKTRSGVLIEIAGMHFLITAGHEMIEHYDAQNPLMMIPEKGSTPIPLTMEFWWTTADSQEDISVCQLLPETVDAMGTSYRFIRLSQVMSQNDGEQGRGLYLVLGYPWDKVRPDEEGVKRAETWKYLTTRFHGDYSRVFKYDSGLHLILDYERATYGRDGNVVHPPGLSGCGIFFCGLPITRSVLRHEDLKLVAIQTAWHKREEYIKGTWIDDVLLILWKYYPAVRDPMRIHGISF